jgi:hypothetical protein
MDDPLHGVWLKLDRAKAHVDALRADVFEASDGDPTKVTLARRFDADAKAVLLYVKRLPEIRDSYGVLIGDAIHNVRSALDHLWWALAVRHLKREPTDDEAKEIQFPIFTRPSFLKPGVWENHPYLRHVSDEAAAKAKTMQPFLIPNPTSKPMVIVDYLALLAELSNVDKHRFIHAAVTVPQQAVLVPPTTFDDCTPVWVDAGKQALSIDVHNFERDPTIKLDDVVVRLYVIPNGPNPDVDLKADFTCVISLQIPSGIVLRMLDAMDGIGEHVLGCVREFEPLFRRGNRWPPVSRGITAWLSGYPARG